MLHRKLLYFLLSFIAWTTINAQDDSPFITYDVPAQNLLKYNRFLINPTFSTVREDKSYVNLLHRNQSVSFDDNNQTYFLSYSGRISDRTGLGLSLYTQRVGIITNFGVLANYAYGVKLSDKSNFTFGANLSYYNSGFDRNRANPIEDDPLLGGFQNSSLLSFQPGFNISYGKFDFGLFAENLFDYNLRTNESVSEFRDKTFSGHLQYTHQFENGSGIFENGRLMPLARLRQVGQDEIVLGGSLILDLPKLGWIQGGYDSFYGAAAGVGFNLNRRISIGYTMEKGLTNNFNNFGLTHEISFAYSFTPNLTEDRVMLENEKEELVENTLEPEEIFSSKDKEIEYLKQKLAENDDILAELMFRQDSIEENRQKDLERRFEMVMRMVRRETNGARPDLEEKAKQMYFINNDQNTLADNTTNNDNLNTIGIKSEQKNNATTTNTTKEVVNPVIPEKTKDEVLATKTDVKTDSPTNQVSTIKDEFTKLAQENGVKARKFRDLQGVEDGYYIVANVYKGEQYLNKFIGELNNKGIQANYFDNSNNGLKYVYLQKFDTWQEALAFHKSQGNGTYEGDMWIMNVENTNYTDKAYVENVSKLKEKATKYDDTALQQNVVVKDKATSGDPSAKSLKIDGLESGYYIIVNVFANQNNANRFVKLLNSRGLSASYFINPENNYKYVYLRRHDSWNNALLSYYTKLNDTYDDKMWIMRVTPNHLT